MIVDSHCHYNLEPLFGSWEHHWQKAQEAGVTASVIVGTNMASSLRAIALAEENQRFVATVGFHPNFFKTEEQLTELTQLETIITNKNVVALGEIGLDYFRLSDSAADSEIKELQKQAFRTQLQLAVKYTLPVCIHVRDTQEQAYNDLLEILTAAALGDVPFILHCVSGSSDYIQKMLKLGAYIGVAGNSTYPKSGAIRAAIALAPADRILLETDAPYLPPQAYRGQTCEPWMIAETAKNLFLEKHITADQILSNTRAAFLDKIPS
jgi:TatD DNase family protein